MSLAPLSKLKEVARLLSKGPASMVVARRVAIRLASLGTNIIEAARELWRKLIALPNVVTSIGMQDWAHVGHSRHLAWSDRRPNPAVFGCQSCRSGPSDAARTELTGAGAGPTANPIGPARMTRKIGGWATNKVKSP
jgi:hypothetical protein